MRRARRQLTIHRRKQRKDIFYLCLSALIFIGINNSILIPLGRHFSSTPHVYAKAISPIPSILAKLPAPLPTEVKVTYQDKRITRLTQYLQDHNSPLADFSAYIIEQSDANGIDWTLLTAISGKESGYCAHIPQASYNCWGIGGASNMYYFKGYQDAIIYEAQLLGNDYRENAVGGIQSKYCPSSECDPNWTSDITEFSQEILASK